MINFLLGAPGGGKSYEAVVFHILPAVLKGRKVITNLPLNVEAFAKIEPAAAHLIELRTVSKGEGVHADGRAWRPFEHEADFGHPWRNDEGQGPLYVIDECHMVFPRLGTRRAVEEWFSMHRHENADALLITQSYGKVNMAIRDLVQIVYRVRKNVAFGSMGSYTRKVQDGLRGDVVNTGIRRYERKYFGLYRSHTKGRSADELGAADIVPFWKRWPVIGAAVFLAVAAVGFTQVRNPLSSAVETTKTAGSKAKHAKPAPQAQAQAQAQAHAPAFPASSAAPAVSASASATVPAAVASDASPAEVDPYEGRGLHIAGVIRAGARELWSLAVSQNGQRVGYITDADLVRSGYEWRPQHECAAQAVWHGRARAVICDAPQVALAPAGASSK